MNAHWIILCFPLQRKSRENQHWAWRSERYFFIYVNPVKILSRTAEEGSLQMTSRPHFSISLIVLALAYVGCWQWAPGSPVKIKLTLFETLVWNSGPRSWQCGPRAATKGPSAQSVNCSLYGARFLIVKCPACVSFWIKSFQMFRIIKLTRRMFVFIHFWNLSKISIF